MAAGSRRILEGRVALVAGGTRGAGRGIAIELGAAGAKVYVTGRSTRAGASPMGRPETIEETRELIEAAGGTATAVPVDHSKIEEVAALAEGIRAAEGCLDILVNDIWGGDPLTTWGVPFWEHSLTDGIRMQETAVTTHLITSWHCAPLLIRSERGLIVEMTDGVGPAYRGSFYYDLAKASVIRLAVGQAADLRPHGVAAVAVTPGFLRSEAVLDHFGVREENWRDAIPKDEHFAYSETPRYVGRAIVHLAAEAELLALSGTTLSSWELARRHGFTDVDGARPDWGAHFDEHFPAQ